MLYDREWPSKAISYMNPEILYAAKKLRLKSGVALIPSPDPEAHVRWIDGSSRHAIGSDGSKLSDATDLFLTRNLDAAALWLAAQSVAEIGGIGIYFDTLYGGIPRVMIHIDLRPERLLWVCPSRARNTTEREYIYFSPAKNNKYLSVLDNELSK